MSRTKQGFSRAAAVAVATALLAGAPPAASREARPPVPTEVEALLAQERPRGSNAMFAQIVTRPHKGYRWSVVAFKAAPAAKTLLMMRFARTAARKTQVQTSQFSWTLPRTALRMDADLKPASLTTRKSMGSNGSIAMKLSEAGRYGRFRAGAGCSGSVSYRVARFGGRFRFHARDEYFKRIGMRGARVLLYREHDYRCTGEVRRPPACPQDLSLNAPDPDTGVAVGAFKTAEGKVDQTVVAARRSGKADSIHTISVMVAVPEAFEASDDLTSATLDGNAAGPWLSGVLSYVGPPGTEGASEDCGPYRSSSGIVTGDYTAHFDSIGPVTPATTGMTAILRREI